MTPEERKKWSADLLAIRREKKRQRLLAASGGTAGSKAGPPPSSPSPQGQAAGAGVRAQRDDENTSSSMLRSSTGGGGAGKAAPSAFSAQDESFLEVLEEQFRQIEKATRDFNGNLLSNTQVGYKIEKEIERQFRALEAKIGLAEELVGLDDDDLEEVFTQIDEKRRGRGKKNHFQKASKQQQQQRRQQEQSSEDEDETEGRSQQEPRPRRETIQQADESGAEPEEDQGRQEEAGGSDQEYGESLPGQTSDEGERYEKRWQGAGSNTKRQSTRSIAALQQTPRAQAPSRFEARALQARPSRFQSSNASSFEGYI